MMHKLLPILLLFCGILSCSSGKKEKHNAPSEKDLVPANDLPSMVITYPDGSKQLVKELKGNVVLVLFQPDCDHCQREAEDIERNLMAFKDYKIYFISSAPADQLKKFSTDYKLNNKPNVFFATTTTESVINSFGPIETPSLYLYDNDGTLVNSFNGEVAIEVVVKYL